MPAPSRALECAQLRQFVAALPHGLDTILGEGGARVSGGEARRIIVAPRAAAGCPAAGDGRTTEGLDAITGARLYAALAAAAHGRTLLLLTHRLAGLEALVDEVATLRGGRLSDRQPLVNWRRRRGDGFDGRDPSSPDR